MRRLRREPLSDATRDYLCKRTLDIANAGNAQASRADRAKARRDEAARLWSQRASRAFDEIRRALRAMAPGNERCMYCEDSEGTDIEHFWPRSRYPWRAFAWENFLWACSACNSNYKRSRFPREGGAPLLVNPVDEEPSDHLLLSPKTGHYVGVTRKGDVSIDVFGLGRHALVETRRDAWVSVQALIVAFADFCRSGQPLQALDVQRTLCRFPHASVLSALVRIAETEAAADLIFAVTLEAMAAHPEIKDWVR